MTDPYRYPKLRWPIDIRMEHLEGQQVLLLTCPLGISPQPLVLVPGVGPILSRFEGTLSIDEITEQFAPYGIKLELVRELASLLDKHLFLANANFFAAEKNQKDQFLAAEVRPAALAGAGYSAVPEELTKEIEKYLAYANGMNSTPSGQMTGLVSPHIDYRRGGISYGLTYSHLQPHDHDLYVLIGTSHQYSKRMFHLTRKTFLTPLGNLPTDAGLVDTIATSYGVERSFADEFLHRREHSLELQLPFIHHLKKTPKVLPILVGSFHHLLNSGKLPNANEEYDAFACALTAALKTRIQAGQRICFIAGVDMAHVGQSFGDKEKLSPEFMHHVQERDKIYLDSITEHAKEKMFAHIAEDEDSRRICGFPTMYTVLDVLERLGTRYSTKVFDYRQAVDYSRECAVTFAGIGLYDQHAAS
jgi:AmmeMemoRadiSam system protein B